MEFQESLRIAPLSTDMAKKIEILAKCELFKDFTEEEITTLAKIAVTKKFPKNQTVFSFGLNDTDTKNFFIIQKGELKLRLKSGKCKTLKQYDCFGEISVLTEYGRTGVIKTNKDCVLIALSKGKIFNPEIIPMKLALKITRKMARKMVNYLAEGDNQPAGAAYLIPQGETKSIEFKQSYNKKNRDKIFQTIGAFFNTEGGSILIGVRDDKKVLGIRKNILKSSDEFKRDLISFLKVRYGSYFSTEIAIDFEEVEDKLILRIDCYKTKKPAFYIEKEKDKDKKRKRYFIRTDATNEELQGMALFHHLKKRDI